MDNTFRVTVDKRVALFYGDTFKLKIIETTYILPHHKLYSNSNMRTASNSPIPLSLSISHSSHSPLSPFLVSQFFQPLLNLICKKIIIIILSLRNKISMNGFTPIITDIPILRILVVAPVYPLNLFMGLVCGLF